MAEDQILGVGITEIRVIHIREMTDDERHPYSRHESGSTIT
jgi:hypothetical protein